MARTGRPKQPLVLEPADREQLERWARRPKTEQRLAMRSRIVLRCAEGLDNDEVAAELGVHPKTVSKWRRRFVEGGPDALSDEPRPGVPRSVLDDTVEEIVRRTIEEAPAGATHWSTRSMARQVGVSASTVNRIWQAFGLKPHLVETFKISTDPLFVEKVRDVVGLYLDPPERALVLCVDEKSQIQALDRSQPVLPILPGTPALAPPRSFRSGTGPPSASQPAGCGGLVPGRSAGLGSREVFARIRARQVERSPAVPRVEHSCFRQTAGSIPVRRLEAVELGSTRASRVRV